MHYNRSDIYPFLHERLLKEPYLDEILTETEAYQKAWKKNSNLELATAESLNESRNVKIPISQKRLLNIQYLIDLLLKYNPVEFKAVYSYQFSVNPENKNLNIDEKVELTFLMPEPDYHTLVASRDARSTESLLQLLSSFRLFNLTKLIKKAKNRNHLTQLIKNQIGSNIFTFKNTSLDKSGLEVVEDFCFHRNNYESVKQKIDVEGIKRIIEINSAAITRRLKNFGILNANVSDYRDTKFNYILSTLTGDSAVALDKKDLIAVKNFQSLRDCLIKVDKVLDPLMLHDAEIMMHISENGITTETNIVSLFEGMNHENFARWESEKKSTGRIISFTASDGIRYIVDSAQYLRKFSDTMKLLVDREQFMSLTESQKDEKVFTAGILAEAGREIASEENPVKILGSNEKLMTMNQLLQDFDFFNQKMQADDKENLRRKDEGQRGGSLLLNIVTAVISIFTRKPQQTAEKTVQKTAAAKQAATKRPISRETKDIYTRIKERDSALIPLSELIEIKPDNEPKIDQVISDLRNHNLKIVIPIYNARQVLYPQRSRKYLIADVEYLLVDPGVIKTPETLGAFMDSVSKFKFKEDYISTSALFTIEKYLNSLFRKNKSKAKRQQA